MVDGFSPEDKVGIRKKSDGPNAYIFTPSDFEKLDNYLIPYTPEPVDFPQYEEEKESLAVPESR